MKILDVPQSGSVAGVTSSRNRYGQYRRTRAIPVNVNSLAQQRARNDLSAWSAAWRGLPQASRDAWDSWASTVTFADALGQAQTLTGQCAFVKVNTVQQLNGLDQFDDTPPESAAFGLGLVTDIDITDPTTITVTTLLIPADIAIAIYASPPMSAGRNFNADYRYIKTLPPATVAGDNDIATALEAKFGTLAAGQKFFVQARTVVDGQSGDFFTDSGVLVP